MVFSHLVASLIALAFVGFIDAIYLYWHHARKKPLVCPLNHDCNAVTESKYGKILGVKTEVFGAIYYLIIIVGSLWFFNSSIRNIAIGMGLLSFLALGSSIYLVYVQKYILKNYCFYCLISALVNLLLFLNLLLLF